MLDGSLVIFGAIFSVYARTSAPTIVGGDAGELVSGSLGSDAWQFQANPPQFSSPDVGAKIPLLSLLFLGC